MALQAFLGVWNHFAILFSLLEIFPARNQLCFNSCCANALCASILRLVENQKEIKFVLNLWCEVPTSLKNKRLSERQPFILYFLPSKNFLPRFPNKPFFTPHKFIENNLISCKFVAVSS